MSGFSGQAPSDGEEPVDALALEGSIFGERREKLDAGTHENTRLRPQPS